MPLKISSKAVSHAKSLISAGKINDGDNWSFEASDSNAIFADAGEDWDKYGLCFLAREPAADPDTKEHYKYPYGKDGEIWRKAVIAIKQRAAQQDFAALVTTADDLLAAIDKKLGKEEDSAPGAGQERRFFPVTEMRLTTDDDGHMFIEGYPIVYEKPADLWGFREIIKRGAAAKALKKSDELVLWNHETDQPMAAKKNGTLEAREDDQGVFIKADVSKTFWGRNGYEAIQNGVVDKMSFAFRVSRSGEKWSFENNMDVREIVEFDEFFDYSPVTYPAYKDTSVIARNKELALRNKPQPGAPGEAGGSPLKVLKEARDMIQRRRDNIKTREGNDA
jgi:hypothetical protein